jgi:hypothetical protein
MSKVIARLVGSIAVLTSILAVGIAPQIASADGSDARRLSSTLQNVADNNTCEQFTSSSLGWAAIDSATDIINTVSGTVTGPDGTPVANAIVFSNQGDANKKLSKMSCAVTNASGAYTLPVLRIQTFLPYSALGTIAVSPPNVSKLSSTQLGSQSRNITASTTGSQDFTLAAANSMQGFAVVDSDKSTEAVTAPTNVMCLDANTSGSVYSLISCSLARGRTISATVTGIQYVGGESPGFRVTLANDPGLIDGDAVVLSGLSGTVSGVNLADLNARWAYINEVGVTDGSYSFDIPSPLAIGKTGLDATGLSGTLTAQQWRSSFTIPNTISVSGVSTNIADKNIAIRIYSRNIVNGVATANTRVELMSNFSYAGNGVEVLTSQNAVNSWERGAWWVWNVATRALCSAAATTGNFNGAAVTNLTAATAVAGCGNVQVSKRSESAWGGQPGWDYRWAQPTHWEVASGVAKFYLPSSAQGTFAVGEVVSISNGSSIAPTINGRAVITEIGTDSGGQTISFSRSAMSNSAKAPATGYLQVSASSNFSTDPVGVFRGDLTLGDGVNQIVQMNYSPFGSSTLVASATVFRVTVADGLITSASYCDGTFDVNAGTCSGSWISAPQSGGKYLLLVRQANFIGKILKPNGDALAPSGSTGSVYVEVQTLQTSGSNYYWSGGGTGGSNGVDGIFKVRLTEGSYKLRAGSPMGLSYPPAEVYLKVTGSGASATFQRCTTFVSNASSESSALTGCTSILANSDTPYIVQYGSADLTGTLLLASSSAAANSWVSVSKPSANCPECWDQVGGVSTNSSGAFALNFADAGTYRLTANPPFNDSSLSVQTIWTATVAISGSTKTVTIGGDSDGVVSLTLDGSNFKGKVLKSAGVAGAFANIEFQKFSSTEQRFTWSNNWANSNSAGEFNANLTTGKWKVMLRPGNSDSGTFSASTYFAYIDTATDPDTINVNSVEACAVASPAGSCSATAAAFESSRFNVLLGSPNVRGYAAKTITTVRNSATGAPSTVDAVSFSGIQVQKYNVDEGEYRWFDIGGSNTSSNGQFSLRLPEGKWRLMLSPRPLDTIAGLTTASFDFTVVSNGTVTCDRAYAFCAAGASPDSGRFDLHLSSANLSGVVSADGTAVDQAQIRVEKWNGNGWQGANLWASASNTGAYALNLDSDGAYKVTSEIPSWKTNAGFSPTSTYVYKLTNTICSITEAQVSTVSSCSAGAGAQLTANIALTGSNVKGLVTSAGSPVSNTWANIMRWNNDFNSWEWVQGVSVSASGSFNSTLRSSLGDTSQTAQRFRIEIFPPWGTTSLTKKVVDLWVGDLEDDNAASHTYVVCSASTFASCDLGSGNSNVKSAASTLTVTMSSGNIAGTVSGPSSATAANPQVNVEKWMQPTWSSNKMWVGTQISSQGSSTGTYSLNTETECESSETTCYFRITANPGWSNPNSWSRASQIIQVRASDSAYQTTTQSDEYTQPTLATSAYVTTALNFALVGSNVSGTIKNGDAIVANTWVGLMKKESTGFYRWIGGGNSSRQGTFGVSTTAYGVGRYRLEVNPPWGSSLSRFSKDIVVASDGTFGVCATTADADAACTGSPTNFILSFPTSNLAVRVCGKDGTGSTCTGVSNAYVNVFLASTGAQVTGSNTNSLGLARFSLDDGEYRGEANPNWTNPDGTRVNFTFTIAGGVLTVPSSASGAVVAVDSSSSPRQLDVRLGSPNVSGTVKYDSDSNAATATVTMANAWVSVRNTATGASTGTNTSSNGQFKLDLAAGSYTLTAYPNNAVAKQPVSANITVAISGSTTTITETGDGTNWNGVMDFDARTINVQFTLTDVGTSARQVLILNSAGTELIGISSVSPNSSGNATHKLALPAGSYTFKIQKLLGDFTSSEACRNSGTITVTSTSGLDATANTSLTTWGNLFDATSDVLACKPT